MHTMVVRLEGMTEVNALSNVGAEADAWGYETQRAVCVTLRGTNQSGRMHASVDMSMPEARALLNRLTDAIDKVDSREEYDLNTTYAAFHDGQQFAIVWGGSIPGMLKRSSNPDALTFQPLDDHS
jgi:hypothetical protein